MTSAAAPARGRAPPPWPGAGASRAPLARRRHHRLSQPDRADPAGRGRLSRATDGGPARSGAPSPSRSALAALQLSFALRWPWRPINAVMGTLIAWVLVRDEFRGQARRQRADRPALRAADDRRRADADGALRPAQPAGRQRRLHPAGRRPGAAVRDAAVRGAGRAAGAGGAGPRDGGGGRRARRQRVHHLPAHHPAQPDAGHPRRRGAGLRPRAGRVRLGRAHLRQHPVSTRGRLGADLQPGRERQRQPPRRPSRSCCWRSRCWCCSASMACNDWRPAMRVKLGAARRRHRLSGAAHRRAGRDGALADLRARPGAGLGRADHPRRRLTPSS